MKIQKQPDYLVFADEAKTGEVQDFPNILRGWGVTIEQTQSKPPMEWMNGAFNRVDKNMLYLLQQGIPEWNSSVLYPVGAVIKYKNKIYIAKAENDNSIPSTSTTKWDSLIKDATSAVAGIVKLNAATNSTSTTEAATPSAVKSAYDLASSAVKKSGDVMSKGLTINSIDKDCHLTLLNATNSARYVVSPVVGTSKFVHYITGTKGEKSRLSFDTSIDAWSFENITDVTINGKSILKVGDGGWNSYTSASDYLLDISALSSMPTSIYATSGTTEGGVAGIATAGLLFRRGNLTATYFGSIEVATSGNVARGFIRTVNAGVMNTQEIITTANINNHQSGIGINQKWQDVKASRALGVTYTNTTSKPIMVSVIPEMWNNGGAGYFYVDDVLVGAVAPSSQYSQMKAMSFIVPVGSAYKMTGSNIAINTWSELR